MSLKKQYFCLPPFILAFIKKNIIYEILADLKL